MLAHTTRENVKRKEIAINERERMLGSLFATLAMAQFADETKPKDWQNGHVSEAVKHDTVVLVAARRSHQVSNSRCVSLRVRVHVLRHRYVQPRGPHDLCNPHLWHGP